MKIFDNSSLQGTLGKKTFSKKSPQNIFKTRLDTFGNDCGHFWNFESFFIFFENFRRLDPPWNTVQKKNFSKKLTQNMSKTRLKTFGNDFRLFCNFEKFLIFLKIFDNSTLQGTPSKKTFSEKSPQNMFKTRLDTFGKILGIFAILKVF